MKKFCLDLIILILRHVYFVQIRIQESLLLLIVTTIAILLAILAFSASAKVPTISSDYDDFIDEETTIGPTEHPTHDLPTPQGPNAQHPPHRQWSTTSTPPPPPRPGSARAPSAPSQPRHPRATSQLLLYSSGAGHTTTSHTHTRHPAMSRCAVVALS